MAAVAPAPEYQGLMTNDGEAGKDPNDAKKAAAMKALNDGRQSAQKRAQEFIMSLNTDDEGPVQKAIGCFLKYMVKPLIIVIMAYVWVGKKVYIVYKMLPMNFIEMIFGAALCFFGGVYFGSIAAIEAFRNFGGAMLFEELQIVYEQGSLVAEASLVDDEVDANKDGIVDVQQMTTNELISHKAKVALIAIKEPERLMNAAQYLMTTWIAVLATLKMQFAQTVAIALGVAQMIELPLTRLFGPPLAMVMGKDLQHWPATIIITIVKIAAVVVASYVQSFISAFYSGIRGGRMFAEGLIFFLGQQGLMDKLPASLVDKPFDPNNSYLDECLAFPLAAVGFYYQVTHGFALEFPWSLLLAPLTLVEWFIRFQVFTA